ncbi:hypothetical protein H5410_008333 [Solanum commersonii]|uniref:Uncharacterized protein n=1 Tax=Solanum commersonii TaxID=4109 RepID=A0A9J6AFG1_SOLCO|nr:hypothetical protein H5410_008333 [Solanum commersonii]
MLLDYLKAFSPVDLQCLSSRSWHDILTECLPRGIFGGDTDLCKQRWHWLFGSDDANILKLYDKAEGATVHSYIVLSVIISTILYTCVKKKTEITYRSQILQVGFGRVVCTVSSLSCDDRDVLFPTDLWLS